MTKQSFHRFIGSAILIAPFLAACGADGAGGGGGDVTVPSCNTGQVLSTNAKGQIICKDLPTGTVSLPQCLSGQALTSNGKGVSCTNLNEGGQDDPAVISRIDLVESTLNMHEIKLSSLATRPSAVRTYVGNTTATYDGNFQGGVTGATNGFDGAVKACVSQYGAGSRLCTAYEVYYSALSGTIASGKEIAKAWVYFPSWNNTNTNSVDPLLGQGDTCGSLTYPTGDKFWTGVAVSTGPNSQTTRWGVRFHGGADAKCSVKLPMACCK